MPQGFIMIKKILTPIIVATTIGLSTPVSAQFIMDSHSNSVHSEIVTDYENQPFIWTAITLGGKGMTTSYDARKFIEAVHLSDELMITLFKKAEGNYEKYNELKADWLAKRTKEGIRQLAYIQMIQKYATRSFQKNEWKAFRITESDYYKRVQENETKTLRSLLDLGKGIVYARKQFGSQLKEIGYPHSESMTDEELYWQWYELQKSRIKESLRLQEVQKYEYFAALGYKKEFYVRPVEIFDFSKEVTQIIEDNINEKRIHDADVAALLQKDPRIRVLLKDIQVLGPDTTELSILKEKAPEVYDDFIQLKNKEVVPFIESDFIGKMNRYTDITIQMAQKYESSQKLTELANQMKEEYLLTNDLNRLMMGMIYDISSLIVTENKDLSNISLDKALFNQYLEALVDYSTDFLSQDELLLQATEHGVRVEDNFSYALNQSFHAQKMEKSNEIKEEVLLNELRKLAHWVLKFQVKKASLSIVPKVFVQLFDTHTWEGQEKIEKFLKAKKYEDDLLDFKVNKLKPYWLGILRIDPTGNHRLSDERAVDFVLDLSATEVERAENAAFKIEYN
ncbi:MAG: hypothetical protein CME63_17535 [Halobacteriovoraceae bacterium]|nr:hypothetical protein [Halobacteriovoraceae bacterium]MBC99551.1 hypothetical protein [Halobacteriovoraceae bacterium]|tara:strand:+ start:22654 stop:24351 length:1698 start_codon:yes stop_codon:yes gene_type:complete